MVDGDEGTPVAGERSELFPAGFEFVRIAVEGGNAAAVAFEVAFVLLTGLAVNGSAALHSKIEQMHRPSACLMSDLIIGEQVRKGAQQQACCQVSQSSHPIMKPSVRVVNIRKGRDRPRRHTPSSLSPHSQGFPTGLTGFARPLPLLVTERSERACEASSISSSSSCSPS